MAQPVRRWRLVALLGAAALGFGCNVMAFPFFLLTGMNPKYDPECKLTPAEKDKEVKAVILAYSPLETRAEFIRVDRELSHLLVQQLQQSFKENKEKVVLVPPRKVEKFKDEHPTWQSMDLVEIARYFEADYVINLEINQLTLYEPGSANQLFRGKATISVNVGNVRKADENPIFDKVYTCEYPKTRGPIPAEGGSVQAFRQAFLRHVARELSWYFTAHPIDAGIGEE